MLTLIEKIKKSLLLLLVLSLIACGEPNKLDRKEELDFAYPSIEFSSFEQVKDNATGDWIGNRSLVTADTAKGIYNIQIKYNHEDLFTITERKLGKDREISKTLKRIMIYEIDDRYIIEWEGGHLHPIHYLSDKQIKIDDSLFEKINED